MRAGWAEIAWYRGPEEADRAFARSHGPDALEIGRDDLADGSRGRRGGSSRP